MILPSDKGKRLVVMDEQMYDRLAHQHIGDDPVINETELRASQRVLNSTSKPLVNIFTVGSLHPGRNPDRVWSNSSTEACEPPKL